MARYPGLTSVGAITDDFAQAGAVMLMHLLDDALAVLHEMATFGEAGVSQRDDQQVEQKGA